ncbi:MAG: ATP-binding protein [Acidimicrobiales bacterium]
MLHNQTLDGLQALRLTAMADALAEQHDRAQYQALTFEERLGLLVDRELTEWEDRRRERYLKSAKLGESSPDHAGGSCAAVVGGALQLINAVGNLGGFVGPYIGGYLQHQSGGSFLTTAAVLAIALVLAGVMILTISPPAVALTVRSGTRPWGRSGP